MEEWILWEKMLARVLPSAAMNNKGFWGYVASTFPGLEFGACLIEALLVVSRK